MPEVVIIPATIGNFTDLGPNRQLKVASYSRVSTEHEEQLTSFISQQTYYNDMILRNPKWSLYKNFADHGISGGNAEKRPDFMKMIRHCKQGKINLIVTKSISRFARNTLDSIRYVRELKAMGVGVYFEKEGINTLEETSELFLTIMSSLAQEELNSLSLNVKMGLRMAMKKGIVHYKYKNFYGYRKGEDGMPSIIHEEAEVVRKIFQLFLAGESIAQILKYLAENQITARHGKSWNENNVRAILYNEKYCGDVILQKTYVVDPISKKTKVNNGELPKYHIKNNHDGIVTHEIFNQVQEERARRTSKRKTSSKTKTESGKYSSLYALGEILICGDCGTKYQRKVWTKRNKTKQPVWRCVSRVDHGTQYCENSFSVDETSLHEAIVEAIFGQAEAFWGQTSNGQVLETQIRQTLRTQSEEHFDVNTAEERIQEIKAQVMQMVATHSRTNTLSEHAVEMKALSDEAKRLSEKVALYKEANPEEADVDLKVSQIMDFYKLIQNAPKEYNDALVRQTIHTIKVLDGETLEIYFKNGAIKIQKMVQRVRKLKAG